MYRIDNTTDNSFFYTVYPLFLFKSGRGRSINITKYPTGYVSSKRLHENAASSAGIYKLIFRGSGPVTISIQWLAIDFISTDSYLTIFDGSNSTLPNVCNTSAECPKMIHSLSGDVRVQLTHSGLRDVRVLLKYSGLYLYYYVII